MRLTPVVGSCGADGGQQPQRSSFGERGAGLRPTSLAALALSLVLSLTTKTNVLSPTHHPWR